jgi:cytosine/adenosine deaminase-related metal-dependent hydrolase
MTRVDLLVHGGVVVSMDAKRRVWADGAVAVRDGAIVDIGPGQGVRGRWQAAHQVDVHGLVVMPGLVNAHVHITGLDLMPGLEPADSPRAQHLERWAIPSHVVNTPEDERVTARFLALAMLRQGITSFIEAGTIRYPEAVLEGLVDLHLRGAIGTWTWDRWANPPEFATSTDQALERMCAALELAPRSARIVVWPTLIGHTSCSDELFQAAAAEARARDCHWSFHMSPGTNDGDVYRSATGRDPLVHLEALGVLDERAIVTHALYVSDAEIAALNNSGARVAFCPAGNLHLASGLSHTARHTEMQRVALGTDSPHNLPLLHAAGLASNLFGDMHGDRAALPPERALEWLTLAGAEALGMADQIGSLEVGKRADLAVFEVTQPIYNIANALVHHPATGRAVHVFIDGQHVVREGHVHGEDSIVAEAAQAGQRVARASGLPHRTGWPLIDGEDP